MATSATKKRSSNSLTTSVALNANQQHMVKQQLIWDLSRFPFMDFRNRFTMLDLAYYMERDTSNQNPNTPQILTQLYRDLELPVLQPNIDAAYAYLTGIFTTGTPIFSVASVDPNAEKTEIARQMEAVIWENSIATGWRRNINLGIFDALKYNMSITEVDWRTRKTFTPTTDMNVNLLKGTVEESFRSGNEIHSWDMYNSFYDVITAPGNNGWNGDFIGNIERLTMIQVWQLIADLRMNNGIVMNISQEFWKSAPRQRRHYVPQIISTQTVNNGTDWMAFFSNMVRGTFGNITNDFEVVTYYRRIIPKFLGITNVPGSADVQIWKFIEINGHLIYAERRTNAHNLFPAIFGQAKEDNLSWQTKGVGETLVPFQQLSSTMWRARVASLARSLSDRAIYDPSKVSEKAVNSPFPQAKIPIRPAGYGKDIRTFYYQIPYNDVAGQVLSSEIDRVNAFAADAAHINKSQRGQFTKGNRTQAEYMDVQDNAFATQLCSAYTMEDQVFAPMKRQILTNILQFQEVDSYTDPTTQQPIEVNPVSLRQATIEFKVADGLIPKSKLLNADNTLSTFQVLAGIPGANQEYDLIGMFVHAMESKGTNLSKFKRKEQFVEQAPIQQQAPQTPAAAPV